LLRSRHRPTQERLWTLERPRLLSRARGILGSPAEAEALVADLCCDFLFRHVDSLRHGAAIPAYLRIMTVRRARRRRARLAGQVPLEPETARAEGAGEESANADRSIWSRWLEECLARLRERARQALKLHFGHDLSYTAIAEAQGCTKQAVGKTIGKSLGALKACIERRRSAASRE
jgi:RNA polymerase sigma factor (sigma-70 family)